MTVVVLRGRLTVAPGVDLEAEADRLAAEAEQRLLGVGEIVGYDLDLVRCDLTLFIDGEEERVASLVAAMRRDPALAGVTVSAES